MKRLNDPFQAPELIRALRQRNARNQFLRPTGKEEAETFQSSEWVRAWRLNNLRKNFQ